MFKVNLSFVPPGGGEVDYSLPVMVPALPREGDYISVLRDHKTPPADDYVGAESFIVRRVWWNVSYPDNGKHSHPAGTEPVGTSEIWIECEFAISPYSSKAHKRAAQSKARYPAKEFEETNY
jgi:hypothetical protein